MILGVSSLLAICDGAISPLVLGSQHFGLFPQTPTYRLFFKKYVIHKILNGVMLSALNQSTASSVQRPARELPVHSADMHSATNPYKLSALQV